MQARLSGKTVSSSIWSTLQFSQGLSKPSTMRPTNLTVTTFPFISTGDSTNVTMEDFKDSTNLRLWKSTGRSRCKFGEEVMIFLLLNSKSLTRGSQATTKDTRTLILVTSPKQKYFKDNQEFKDNNRQSASLLERYNSSHN